MRRGFTIIELATVVAIMVLVAGLSLPAYNLVRNRARVTQAHALVESVAMAMTAYNMSAVTVASGGMATSFRAWDWNRDSVLDGLPSADAGSDPAAQANAAALEAVGYRGFAWTANPPLPGNAIDTQGHIIDPWGSALRLRFSATGFGGTGFGVWSIGPDRIDQGGTEGSDDIASWRR